MGPLVAATVLFPTPPLPAPTRMMFFTPGVMEPAAPGAARTWGTLTIVGRVPTGEVLRIAEILDGAGEAGLVHRGDDRAGEAAAHPLEVHERGPGVVDARRDGEVVRELHAGVSLRGQ